MHKVQKNNINITKFLIKKIIKEEIEKNKIKDIKNKDIKFLIKKIIKEEIKKKNYLIKESKKKEVTLHLLALAIQTAQNLSAAKNIENLKPVSSKTKSYIEPVNSNINFSDDDGINDKKLNLSKNKQTISQLKGIDLTKVPDNKRNKRSRPKLKNPIIPDPKIKNDLSAIPFNSLIQDLQINKNDRNSIRFLDQLEIDNPITMLTLASQTNIPILSPNEKINPKFINLFKEKLENI